MGKFQCFPRALAAAGALGIPFLPYEQAKGVFGDMRNLEVINIG